MSAGRIGILVSGGPAPGINAVIGAATIEAVNRGYEVIGFYDGFRWLSGDRFDPDTHSVRLDIARVARIHFDGGSIIRTSRASLVREEDRDGVPRVVTDPERMERTLANLERLGVEHLITIGGDGSLLSARAVARTRAVRVVHVPKTIDNDLPLPHDVASFGFSTARFFGTQIVKNLMQDSQTTGRWFLVTAMGRSAGWLALAIGESAGATLTVIPEEFSRKTTLKGIADVLEGAILKRLAMGKPDGVAVVAEGLAYRLGDMAELERASGKPVPLDAAGRPRLADIPLGPLLKEELESRFAARGRPFRIVSHMLGYELRSADPTPADMAYGRGLGHGAVRMIMNLYNDVPPGAMVSLINGNLVPMDLDTLVQPDTGRPRTRTVDVISDQYRMARAYMIRLERADLENADLVARMAAEASLTPEEFRGRYENAATRLVDGIPVE